MSDDGWLIENDGTGKRWDWLNVVCAEFPYLVFRVKPDDILGRRFLHCRATLKGAKRLIEQEKKRVTRVVHVEGGTHFLPDLRTTEYARSSERV